MLVFDVLGTSNFDRCTAPDELPPDAPQPIQDLFSNYREINKKNYLESYHDAVQSMEETLNLFNLGYLSIELRAALQGAVLDMRLDELALLIATALQASGYDETEESVGELLIEGDVTGVGYQLVKANLAGWLAVAIIPKSLREKKARDVTAMLRRLAPTPSPGTTTSGSASASSGGRRRRSCRA